MNTELFDKILGEAVALGDDNLIAEKRERALRSEGTFRAFWWAFFAYTVLAISYAVLSKAGTDRALDHGWVYVVTVLAAGAMLVVCGHPGDFFNVKPGDFLPISESEELCGRALHLVETQAVAARLRDAIVATGRQLYVADYALMKRLVDAEREENAAKDAAEKHRLMCAKLHNLPGAEDTLVEV